MLEKIKSNKYFVAAIVVIFIAFAGIILYISGIRKSLEYSPVKVEKKSEERSNTMTAEEISRALEDMEKTSQEKAMTAEEIQKAMENVEQTSQKNTMTAEEIQKALQAMENK